MCPALVKPPAPPTVEHWEVAQKMEEWQEVNTKKTKPKGAPPADDPNFAAPAAALLGGDAAARVGADTAPPLSVLNPPNKDSTIGGKKLLPAIYRP